MNYDNKCPFSTKWELVNWLVKYRGFAKSKANNLSKKQCYAIWYKHINDVEEVIRGHYK